MTKKSKKVGNKGFPEGAVSANMVNKINKIHLSRMLYDGEADDLIPVIESFSEGKILEHIGQMKRARDTFRNILKKNPRNRWAMEALRSVEDNLH